MTEESRNQRMALFAYTDAGCVLAKRLCGLLSEFNCEIHTTEQFAQEYALVPHKSICRDMGEIFGRCRVLIFVCSCGIAVRAIAPYVRSKTTDPAVLVMDDMGKFVIPLLSGHIGGANALAARIAGLTGAVLVATTATDIHGRFSADAWAAKNDCHIASLEAAKTFSAAILKRDLPVLSDFPLQKELPCGLYAAKPMENAEIGLYIGIWKKEPFQVTLRLVPRAVAVGIGCRKKTGEEQIEAAVLKALAQCEIDPHAIRVVASIDVKKDEEGLLAYAAKQGAVCRFFSAEELERAEGCFAESEFVKDTVGVGNVCERAAALCGRIIFSKTKYEQVTVAVAVLDWEVRF